ncbi:AEC family transporter [Evansella sp. AB-rgal1]|uniref:AEC family transporter n=1 Tax=Evansella sp. AB-rgal1 TaxID=3242696 RepID=UPI00359CC55E
MHNKGETAVVGNFIFALTIIVCGLLAGRSLRILTEKGKIQSHQNMHKLLQRSTLTALLVVNPLIILGAFWYVQLEDIKLILLPILGGTAILFGGALAIVAAKLLHMKREQTGAMFSSGTFTNLGSFGNLFCYVFLGEASLAFVAMYRLFEDFIYYAIGFPVAQSYGEEHAAEKQRSALSKLVRNPFVILTVTTILVGTLLNLSPLERPAFYAGLNSILVPIFTILLIVPTGFNMKLGAVKGYIKESMIIAAIKYAIVPVAVIMVGYLTGLHVIYDGIVFKTVVILAVMPPGFTSLVPPQLYKLDLDLANSSWLINTVLLIIILPIVFLFM